MSWCKRWLVWTKKSMLRWRLRSKPARYFLKWSARGSLTRYDCNSSCKASLYLKGTSLAEGSTKKSNGLNTAISVTRSTVTLNSVVFLGNTRRAW